MWLAQAPPALEEVQMHQGVREEKIVVENEKRQRVPRDDRPAERAESVQHPVGALRAGRAGLTVL